MVSQSSSRRNRALEAPIYKSPSPRCPQPSLGQFVLCLPAWQPSLPSSSMGVPLNPPTTTQREGRPVEARLRAHPGLDNFLMGLATPGSACSAICQTQAGMGEARPTPGLGGTDPGQRASGRARAVQL